MKTIPLEVLSATELPEPDDDLDALAFAAVVREASDGALEELMTADQDEREQILDAIFARAPARLRPDAPRDLHAVVHWRVGGRPAGGEDFYELVIRGGACTVRKAPVLEPHATVTIEATAFLRLVSGAVDAPLLASTGRLSVAGDEELALYVESLFERA
jgi:SCP-2 sterol transfer family protein